MKLVPDIYYLPTFNIDKNKNKGVNESVGGDTTKKTPENAMKLREFWL